VNALFFSILNHAFSSNRDASQLQKKILEQEYFYLVFSSSGLFLIEGKTLPVLLQENDANIYVNKTAVGCSVKTVLKAELLELISSQANLKEIRFYSAVPIHISFPPQALLGSTAQTPPKTSDQAPKPMSDDSIQSSESSPEGNAVGLEPGGDDSVSELMPDLQPSELELQPPELPSEEIPQDFLSVSEPEDPTPESIPETPPDTKPEAAPDPSPKPSTPAQPNPQSTPESAKVSANPAPAAETPQGSQFLGVDKVKEYFSLFDVNARNKIDPGHRFTNIRTLVETLCQQNGLDFSDIDEAMDLRKGTTNSFIKDPVGKPAKKEMVLKYLKFFGLEEYWLFYQDCCMEIKRQILASPDLNRAKIKYPAAPYAEKFRLTEIREGKYEGAILYRVTLVGEKDTVKLYVTNPMKPVLKIDRQYQLLDRDGKPRPEDEKRKNNDIIQPPSKDDLAYILSGIEKKKPAAGSDRTFEQVRKDKIIFYLKDKLKLRIPSAESKYKEFESDTDILNEFYEYIVNRKFGKIEVQGYTARRLIKELKITEPYEAFHYLVELRANPGETKQKLKLIEGSLKAKKNEGASSSPEQK